MARDGDLPTGRLARTARLAGLVMGQGGRLLGTRVAGVGRSRQRSQAASQARVSEVAEQLLVQLGQMKGVAVKLGQVLSAMELPVGSPEEREAFKARLGALRDAAPALPFERLEQVLVGELGGAVADIFDDFDHEAFAAASIGQVHRAVLNGQAVAVKVQYPGVAEAVEADLRNLGVLPPLLKPLAPDTDFRALIQEIRDAIGEELDYEIEAQHQRAFERAFRGHPFSRVPKVFTEVSTRRVLVTEYLPGEAFADIRRRPQPERDLFAEMLVRFYWSALARTGRCTADPHPGNYVLHQPGVLAVFDFGQTRVIPPGYLEAEQALARAVRARRPDDVHAAMRRLGMLPNPDHDVHGEELLAMALSTTWQPHPGACQVTPELVAEVMEASSPRSPYAPLMRKLALPPQSPLLRKMDAMLLGVLSDLRATADWGRIAAEYDAGEPPSTPLGRADREFWDQRHARPAWPLAPAGVPRRRVTRWA